MESIVVTLSTPTCWSIANVMQGSERIRECIFCIVDTVHSVVSIVGVHNSSLRHTSDVVCWLDSITNFLVYGATVTHIVFNFKVVFMIGWDSNRTTWRAWIVEIQCIYVGSQGLPRNVGNDVSIVETIYSQGWKTKINKLATKIWLY